MPAGSKGQSPSRVDAAVLSEANAPRPSSSYSRWGCGPPTAQAKRAPSVTRGIGDSTYLLLYEIKRRLTAEDSRLLIADILRVLGRSGGIVPIWAETVDFKLTLWNTRSKRLDRVGVDLKSGIADRIHTQEAHPCSRYRSRPGSPMPQRA